MAPRIVVVDYHKGNLKSVERGLAAVGAEAFASDDPAAIVRADAVVLPGVGAFADAAATMEALGQAEAVRERIAAGAPFLGICLGMHLMFEEGVEGAPEEDDEASTHNARGLAVLPGVVGALPKSDAAGRAYKVPHVGWNTVVPPDCQLSELLDVAVFPSTRPSRDPGMPCLGSAEQGAPARAHSVGSNGPLGCSMRTEVRGASAIPRISGVGETLADVDGSASDSKFSCPLFEAIPAGEYFYFTHGYIAPDGPFVIGKTAHSVTFPSAVQYGEAAFGVQFHPEKSSDAGAQLLRNFVNIVKGA